MHWLSMHHFLIVLVLNALAVVASHPDCASAECTVCLASHPDSAGDECTAAFASRHDQADS